MDTSTPVNIRNIGDIMLASLNNGLAVVVTFVPKFIAGLIILLIGLIVATLIKRLILEVFRVLKIEATLHRYGVPESGKELSWTVLLAEIARWFVIILFLIPTADIWSLPQIGTILNTFLLYLPNVFIAAIIAMIGFVFARLSHDVILASMKNVNKDTAKTVASVVRWAILIFILLAILNQLGVAVDLIRILFTGFVAMVAIGGGIAFGLGGKDLAKDILEGVRKKLK
jgi:hypothetical protein